MNLRFPLRFGKKRLIEEQDPGNIANEMSFDSQHGARPMEGRKGWSVVGDTRYTRGFARTVRIWPRFLLRVLIYGDSGKAARERDGSGSRKEREW